MRRDVEGGWGAPRGRLEHQGCTGLQAGPGVAREV